MTFDMGIVAHLELIRRLDECGMAWLAYALTGLLPQGVGFIGRW